MQTNDVMREQKEAGVVFVKYVNEDGLRVSHPVKMESCNGNPVPWFPHVYAPNDHVFIRGTSKEKTQRLVGRIAAALPEQGPPTAADHRAAARCLQAIYSRGYVLVVRSENRSG